MYLFNTLFSFPLDKYPEVRLLGDRVVAFIFLRSLHSVFHSGSSVSSLKLC